jgi:hypothetical protein
MEIKTDWVLELPSKKELAEKIGMSPQDFSRAISGKPKNAKSKGVFFSKEQLEIIEKERLLLISLLQINNKHTAFL